LKEEREIVGSSSVNSLKNVIKELRRHLAKLEISEGHMAENERNLLSVELEKLLSIQKTQTKAQSELDQFLFRILRFTKKQGNRKSKQKSN